jgi:FMN phosphatase YigB (HAD superfamily)
MAVRAVFFDVGETLTNEGGFWAKVGRLAGVEPHVMWAGLGAAIERREHHRRAFDLLAAEFPVHTIGWDASELYPDALPCLQRLRRGGYFLGIAGNAGGELVDPLIESAGIDVDFVASSVTLGVEKPAPAFFERLAEASGFAAAEIAYVGDRVDNDVVPAADAGMGAVFLRRGPWGYLQAGWPEAGRATVRIESLDELPEAFGHG